MIRALELNALKACLFAFEPATVFAILDGASMPDLPATLASFRPEYKCLYRGELKPDMAEVAPYLVVLEREAPFTDWLLLNGWGKRWGIFGVSRAGMSILNRHLRRFVKVEAAGRSLYFRYYDPEMMRNFLPTCTFGELRTVFGPVLFYFLEDEDAQFARRFVLGENGLQQKVLPLHEVEDCQDLSAAVIGNDAPAVARSLTVRPEQIKQIGQNVYAERMRSYLNEFFPESKEVPKHVMDQDILELADRAAGYKLVLETHVAPFIVGAWIFGKSFDEDFLTVKEILEDYEMDCGRKAQWLWDFIDMTLGILEDGMQER